jgi:hypothetical protein
MELLEESSAPRVVSTDDYNTLLVLDPDQGTLRQQPLEGVWVVRIVGHVGDLVLAELYEEEVGRDPWFHLLALDLERLEEPIARLAIYRADPQWHGPDAVWKRLPRFFAGSHSTALGGEALVRLLDEPGRVSITEVPDLTALQDSEWPLHVLESEGIVAMGRGNVGINLVLYDVNRSAVVAIVELPRSLASFVRPRGRRGTSELWVACYDTIVRIDMKLGIVIDKLNVGGWRDDRIADFAFDSRFERCAVVLGTSGVVLAVDAPTLRVTHRAETAESLREIVLLDDGRFIARTADEPRFIVRPLEEEVFSLPKS